MNSMVNAQNPLLSPYTTLHGTVPFDKIKIEHYEPAILEGIKQQNEEIEAIIQNPEKATFSNTIEAYEASGELLDKATTCVRQHAERRNLRRAAGSGTETDADAE